MRYTLITVNPSNISRGGYALSTLIYKRKGNILYNVTPGIATREITKQFPSIPSLFLLNTSNEFYTYALREDHPLFNFAIIQSIAYNVSQFIPISRHGLAQMLTQLPQ